MLNSRFDLFKLLLSTNSHDIEECKKLKRKHRYNKGPFPKVSETEVFSEGQSITLNGVKSAVVDQTFCSFLPCWERSGS